MLFWGGQQHLGILLVTLQPTQHGVLLTLTTQGRKAGIEALEGDELISGLVKSLIAPHLLLSRFQRERSLPGEMCPAAPNQR